MTDRELLENAAKAAGLTIHANNQASRDACGAGDVGLWISRESTCWNPITDDDDALRLAVKLRLTVSREDQGAVKAGWVADQRVPFTSDGCGPWYWKEWLKDHNWDDYAATRRAIVRAAAEIGKNL